VRYFITGVYGFLGYSTAKHLLEQGHTVVGVDRLKGAVSSKAHRVQDLARYTGRFQYRECDISRWSETENVILGANPDVVVHFAAQYSVPHSTPVMHNYIQSNLAGFMHVCEGSKNGNVKRIVYASSTWVSDHEMPWTMYGASKQFNESAANIYSRQFNIETVGLRYGSCFGPMVRNDVGPYIAARRLFRKEPHPAKNAYIYKSAFLDVDDAVGATIAAINCEVPKLHNICTVVADDERHNLTEIVRYFEKETGVPAVWQPGYVDPGPGGTPTKECDELEMLTGYRPRFKVEDTAVRFIDWFREEWTHERIR